MGGPNLLTSDVIYHSGGMGDIYFAEDPRIEQQVAIKVIRSEMSPYTDPQAATDAARLFQREVKAIVKLDHPHILSLFDYGEEYINNTSIIYFVMPYRPDGSLTDWLRRRNTIALLPPQDIGCLVQQAADALQHAHDRQIIHQDVKPSNFLVRERKDTPGCPELFLADFGIARLMTTTSSASQSIRGTPTYMAPEQWEGHPGLATDQYALAIMTYELLTGRPPFQGAFGQMMYQHLSSQPLPPSTLNPRLSQDIDTALVHALAKKPEERFSSITEFSRAIQKAIQSLPDFDSSTFVKPLGIDAPTFLNPSPPSVRIGDIYVILAISPAEALHGTTRTVNLPAGWSATVTIPPNTIDGHVIRLDGQGEPAGNGSSGALFLTIAIKEVASPTGLPARHKGKSNRRFLRGVPLFLLALVVVAGSVFAVNPVLLSSLIYRIGGILSGAPTTTTLATIHVSPLVRTVTQVFHLTAKPGQINSNLSTSSIPAKQASTTLSASLDGATTGNQCDFGLINCQHSVNASDVSNIASQLKQNLKNQITKELQKQVQRANGKTVSDILFNDVSQASNPPIGTVSNTVTVTLTEQGTLEYVVYGDAQQLARQLLIQKVQQLGSNYTLLSSSIQIGQAAITGMDNSRVIMLDIAVGGLAQYRFPSAQLHSIGDRIKGMKQKDALAFIKHQNGVDQNSVSISLSRGEIMPTSVEQIKIIAINPTNFPFFTLPTVKPTKTSASTCSGQSS